MKSLLKKEIKEKDNINLIIDIENQFLGKLIF